MQNLLAARNEAVRTAKAYTELGCMDNGYIFYIPVFENMPETPAPKPEIDGNPNAYLQMLSIEEIETIEPTTEYPETEETIGGSSEDTTSEVESEPETEPEPTLPRLEPEFDRSIFRYDVYVDENVRSITFDAKAIANVIENAASGGRGKKEASVEGAGKKELSYGENVFTIRVTAGNGTTFDYEVHVFREEPETSEETSPENVGETEEDN